MQKYMQEDKLQILEYFWKHTEDNMFIMAQDENGDFFAEDINPAQAKNFNLKKEDLLGIPLKKVFGKENAKIFEDKYNKSLEKNTPLAVDESLIINGIERCWNTMVIPMRGNPNRILGIAREITELIETKNSLEKLNFKLEDTIKERTQELEEANSKLQNLATIDHLTNLRNRRYFYEQANSFLALAKRLNTPISLIYMDLDYFKKVNDTYGHAFGDKVLKEFASLISTIARESDITARFGGEEFILLLPFTEQNSALEIATRIQEKVKNHAFMYKDKKVSITLSMGITSYKNDYFSIDSLIEKADKALYHAKNSGRDKIEIYK